MTQVEDSLDSISFMAFTAWCSTSRKMSESDLAGRGDPSHQSDRITLVLIGGNKKPNELIPLVKALHIEN